MVILEDRSFDAKRIQQELQSAYGKLKGYFGFRRGAEQKPQREYFAQLLEDVLSGELESLDEARRKEVLFEFQRNRQSGEQFQAQLARYKQAQLGENAERALRQLAVVLQVFVSHSKQRQTILEALQDCRQLYRSCGLERLFRELVLAHEKLADPGFWIAHYQEQYQKQSTGLQQIDTMLETLVVDQGLAEIKVRRVFQDMRASGFELKFCKEVAVQFLSGLRFDTESEKLAIIQKIEKEQERPNKRIFDIIQIQSEQSPNRVVEWPKELTEQSRKFEQSPSQL